MLNKISMLFRYNAKINLRDNEGQNAIEINVVMSNPKQIFRGRHRRDRFGESKIGTAALLLLAAGELLQVPELKKLGPRGRVSTIEVPDFLHHDPELRFCLKHLCREAIRNHLVTLNPHSNLFHRIPQLGLPSTLNSYLLYDMTLPDDTPPSTLPKVAQLSSVYKFP